MQPAPQRGVTQAVERGGEAVHLAPVHGQLGRRAAGGLDVGDAIAQLEVTRRRQGPDLGVGVTVAAATGVFTVDSLTIVFTFSASIRVAKC